MRRVDALLDHPTALVALCTGFLERQPAVSDPYPLFPSRFANWLLYIYAKGKDVFFPSNAVTVSPKF